MVDPGGQGQPQFTQALAAAQTPATTGATTTAPDGETVRPLNLSDIDGSANLTSSQLNPIIDSAAQKYGVDPELVKAVIQTESSGNPNAVSNAGALGLMQLMPSNVSESKVSDPFDPTQNINAGVSQLSGYLKKYDGNVDQALAAYNAGPAAVQEYHGIPPYHETQNYIKKIHDLLNK
jgi:soluble lytic murein transglycosylase-like protein